MKKAIREGRVLKSSQPTLENMVRVLVDALKAEGFDAEASKNGGAKTTYVDVAEFEKNIEITLEKGAKYKIVPKMDEIDFDLEGKGMEAFKEDAEDLAKELATKLDKDYKDSDDTEDDDSGNEFVVWGQKGNRKLYLCGSNTWKSAKAAKNDLVSVFDDEAEASDVLEKVAYKAPAIDFDDLGIEPKKIAFSEDTDLKESFNESRHVKLTSLEQIRKCLDAGIDVYIDDIGPFGEGTAHVIDTTINTNTAEFDQDTLSDFDYSDEDEFWENEDGAEAIVIDESWGQSGCNFQELDAYSVDDFDVYVYKNELEEAGISLDAEASESDEASEAQDGYVVKVTMKGPTGEWDQIGYASHSDDVDFDEGVIGWDDIENVCAIPEEAAKELLAKIVVKAKPVEEFMFSIVPYGSER